MYSLSSAYNSQDFEPFFDTKFIDCLQGSVDYDSLAAGFVMSPSSSEALSSVEGKEKSAGVGHAMGGGDNLSAANSSMSSYSSGAGAEEEYSDKSKQDSYLIKGEDGGESSQQVKGKKIKGNKKEREPRVAFMTKTKVDHLEDGYRWRKYGQKAVKNSSYPRNYYRCTTKKCTVKKRVERSCEDPSMVITTYEGRHNHPVPTSLRGNASAFFTPFILTSTSFPQDLFMQMPSSTHISSQRGLSSIYSNIGCLEQYHNSDYGLLQDIVPSVLLKEQPCHSLYDF